MEENQKKNNKKTYRIIAFIALIISVLCLSIAYANYTLNIIPYGNGYNIDPKWSIVWDDLKDATVKGNAIKGKLSIINNGQTIIGSFGSLQDNNDSIKYTWYAHNKGNIDAKVTAIFKPNIYCVSKNKILASRVCKDINVDITYDNNKFDERIIGSKLLKGEKKKVTITLTYNKKDNYDLKDKVYVNVDQLNMIYYTQYK